MDLAQRTTRERVRAMTKQGLTPRQIALALGLSTQAIYDHLKRDKTEGETKEQSA